MLTRCKRRVGPYRCCSVVRGDSVKLMAEMPPRSVDVIWTDPPYGNRNQAGDLQAALNARHGRKNKPIANDSLDRMRAVVDGVLLEAWRVLSVESSAVCCCCAGGGGKGIPTFAWLAKRMDSAGLRFFHSVIWDKKNPGLGWRYRRQHEMVIVGHRRGGRLRWNDDAAAAPNIVKMSAPRDLGSGTTAVAAAELGRHYLGFELNEGHCRVARCRIATAQKGKP